MPLLSELKAMEASPNEMALEVFSNDLALFPSLTGDKVNLVHMPPVEMRHPGAPWP